MSQSEVPPGTSTPRVMQEDGAQSAMTISSQTGANPRRPSGVRRAWRRGLRSALAAALVCAALGGCTSEQFQKGYILPNGALEQIPIGASQDQVLIVMGTPSTVATLNGEVFYYISQRAERPVAFMPQKLTDQRVIAIYFDKNRQVTRLANYGLQDGKIFDFISRTTPTSGQEMSYLAPLFKLLSFH
jgi:outer membrane protein assembly factor BamE (lipoprotein component of BamABCDE complex)